MQNCREVSYLVASDGLEHAAWPTRLLTRLHLLMCRHCRRYATELTTIGRVSREALERRFGGSQDSGTARRIDH